MTREPGARAGPAEDLCQLSIMLIAKLTTAKKTPIPILNLDFYSFLDAIQNASNEAKATEETLTIF